MSEVQDVHLPGLISFEVKCPRCGQLERLAAVVAHTKLTIFSDQSGSRGYLGVDLAEVSQISHECSSFTNVELAPGTKITASTCSGFAPSHGFGKSNECLLCGGRYADHPVRQQ